MSKAISQLNESVNKKLRSLAKEGGFEFSVLKRLYLTKIKGRDLDEITENGMTALEELELLAMGEEGGDGIVYNSVEEYIKSLDE